MARNVLALIGIWVVVSTTNEFIRKCRVGFQQKNR
jgi:hypothetical protein